MLTVRRLRMQLLLTVALMLMSALIVPAAGAAPPAGATPTAGGSGNVQPMLTGCPIGLSPNQTTVSAGQVFPILVSWGPGCENVNVDYDIDWMDGSSHHYDCNVNCTSGNQTEYHAYNSPGVYQVTAHLSGAASGSSGVITITVN